MRRQFVFAITLVFVTGQLFSQQKDDWEQTFQKISGEVLQHSRAYSTLQQATETIGHRLTGSANGVKAESYAFELLKSYGLDPHYQSFEAESWSRGSLTVTINNVK